MPQTALVWQEDADRSGAAAGITGLDGGQTFVTGDKVQIPHDLPYIAMMAFLSESDTYYPVLATLSAPNIGGKGVNNLRLTRGCGATLKESALYDFRDAPLVFEKFGGSLVECQAYEEDEAGVAHYVTVVLIVSDGALPYVPHRLTHIVRATLAATAAAGIDKDNTITLQDDIPPGRYRLWGADIVSATGTVGRLKVPGYGRPPGFFIRRTERDAIPQLNHCVLPRPMVFDYGQEAFPVKVDIVAEAAETPDHMQLFLEKVG